MTEEQVLSRLRTAVKVAGGQRAFARLHGFSASYVNDVLLKRRQPAQNICAVIGIARLVVYTVRYAPGH